MSAAAAKISIEAAQSAFFTKVLKAFEGSTLNLESPSVWAEIKLPKKDDDGQVVKDEGGRVVQDPHEVEICFDTDGPLVYCRGSNRDDEAKKVVVDTLAKADFLESIQRIKVANDNTPQTRALVLSDWTSKRFDADPPPIEYLVDGAIERGIPGIINAMGDVGKSFKLLELCRRVALEPLPNAMKMPPPTFGGQVTRNGTAVFITAEDGEKVVHRRLADLDPKLARLSEKGERLIVVPLPDAGGPKAYWKYDAATGLAETDDFKRFRDQLLAINDLELVVIDPLATFAHAPINDDPAAGQFVCSSLGALAAQTQAVVLTAHHMRKSNKPS